MKKHLIIYALLLISVVLSAKSPKREMRAAWLTTVFRIDWPSTLITSTGNQIQIDAQKKEMTRILDSLVSANMNAVHFQIRSRCDAMYKSSYEPWSTDLVATRGMDPGYDPLQFVIEEGHKRGLEVHAWLNPYRFGTSPDPWAGKAGDYKTTNPDWILTYPISTKQLNGFALLDPGKPEVIKRITDIVSEVVTNYDVDGILFDDYFYAYGGTPDNLDITTQNMYKPVNMSVGDWRRANIAQMVASVYNAIQQIKPYVTFGVSPFGIWTTNSQNASKEDIELPLGITGGNMYDEIYCDPIPWMKTKTVDFISPQLYWPTNAPSQSYSTLSKWWSDLSNRFGVHMYASQNFAEKDDVTKNEIIVNDNTTISPNSLSNIERASLDYSRKTKALNPTEFGLQIDINRDVDRNGAPGTIFYPSNRLTYSKTYIKSLKENHFKYKALTPAITWKKHSEYGQVSNLYTSGNQLRWDNAGDNLKYSIYAIPLSEMSNLQGSIDQYLAGVSYTNSYTIPDGISSSTHCYAVAILDRYGNEFASTFSNGLQPNNIMPNLTLPLTNTQVIHPAKFEWDPSPNGAMYQFELAEDEKFENITYTREIETNSIVTSQMNMVKEKPYYWRVKSRVAGALDKTSEVRKVNLEYFSILNPSNTQPEVSTTPQIEWNKIDNNLNNVTLEISKTPNFSSNNIIFTQSNIKDNTLIIPEKLLTYNNTYYIRAYTNSDNWIYQTQVVKIETPRSTPSVPQILTPQNNSTFSGTTLNVTWDENPFANQFRIELSQKNTFPLLGLKISYSDAYKYDTSFSNLSAGIYYLRAKALYGALGTNWSDVVQVTISGTSINESDFDKSTCYIVKNNNQNELVISINEPSMISATIYSITGVKVASIISNQLVEEGKSSISLPNNLAKGIYTIKVNIGNTIKTIKFIN